MFRVAVANPWIAVLALSLPYLDFPGYTGSSYVRPFALLIAFAGFGYRLLTQPRTIAIPRDTAMKFALTFWGWGLLGALVMPYVVGAPNELKGISLGARIFRDMAAMSLGFLFWILVRVELPTPADLIRAVRFMLTSFWIVLAFCLVQILVVVSGSDAAKAVDEVLKLIRVQQQAGYGKIFGLAPEASMLADQLMTIYFPFVLASIFENVSLFRASRLGVSVEQRIFVLGIGILFFTLSRIGFITLLVLMVCAYFLGPLLQGKRRRRIPLTGLLVVAGIFGIAIFAAGDKFTEFFSSFGGVDQSIEEGVWSNVTRAGSMAAGVYMALDHPLGVGTGALPFMFERYVPDWALISPEIQALLGNNYDYLAAMGGAEISDIAERLPDAKALPVRVAAEMGLPGLLILFGGWAYQVRGSWRVARDTPVPYERVIGFGCVLSFLAMLPLAFSVNSYVWVHWLFVSAIATALIAVHRRRTAELSKRSGAGA
jgi:hypothetical protein